MSNTTKTLVQRTVKWGGMAGAAALMVVSFIWMSTTTVTNARRESVDRYYESAADAACQAFQFTVREGAATGGDELKAIADRFYNRISLDEGGRFSGIELRPLDSNRFTLKVKDREALMRTSELRSRVLVEMFEQRALARSVHVTGQPDAKVETCADASARQQDQIYGREIERDPLLDLDKRPAWN